ncbi:hypothetical protein QFZ73_003758 [Peribacillus sp. V2I11]|nr:hypothetical protein [Peribacillus sp. V2I11]
MIGRGIWKKGAPFFLLLLLLIVWESVTVLLKVEEWLLPAPSAIFIEGMESYRNLYGQLISTTGLALSGFFYWKLHRLINRGNPTPISRCEGRGLSSAHTITKYTYHSFGAAFGDLVWLWHAA